MGITPDRIALIMYRAVAAALLSFAFVSGCTSALKDDGSAEARSVNRWLVSNPLAFWRAKTAVQPGAMFTVDDFAVPLTVPNFSRLGPDRFPDCVRAGVKRYRNEVRVVWSCTGKGVEQTESVFFTVRFDNVITAARYVGRGMGEPNPTVR